MTREEIQNRIAKVITAQLQISEDSIQPDSHFVDDLGADSLDLTELVVAFEDEFNLEIPDSDFNHVTTVRGVVDYLEKRIQQS
ncbi:MAG: acyl carrier protein [Alicyclobacillaceae bacterium]|jgi:acyl carrier protein|nr:acyl carrier protein [Alicyclobacillaceae bacterium]MCY0897151.1 acyl carrier protein [Alicyclobacillaceae bacterium]